MTFHDSWLDKPRPALDDEQLRWLRPPGPWLERLSRLFYCGNWVAMRILFRLHCRGLENLPAESPFLLTPNHSSSLDPLVLAAVLPLGTLRHTRWVALRAVVFRNPLVRLLNRIGRSMPVDRDLSALSAAAALLEQGQNLIWFPEGTRSRRGELQDFQPGVGTLMLKFQIPAIPIAITGAYQALPPDRTLPKVFRDIRVAIGRPLLVDQVDVEGDAGEQAARKMAAALRERVRQLQGEDV